MTRMSVICAAVAVMSENQSQQHQQQSQSQAQQFYQQSILGNFEQEQDQELSQINQTAELANSQQQKPKFQLDYQEDEEGQKFTETEGGATREFKVSLEVLGKHSTMRLDHFLQSQEPGETREEFKVAIKNGLVYVNGMPRKKPNHQVQFMDQVKIFAKRDLMRFKVRPEAIPLDIVYEDDCMLIINKAANMVVYPGWGHSNGTLLNALLHYFGLPTLLSMYKDPYNNPSMTADKEEDMGVDELMYGKFFLDYERKPPPGTAQPRIVNRLDKGTTGLLVVSKDLESHRNLLNQFRKRSVMKSYVSVLVGYPSNDVGRIRNNIGTDLRSPDRYAVFKLGGRKGKIALCSYRVLCSLAHGTACLCKWKIRTGRSHQIRVHAERMGNPVFGDEVYGKHRGILNRMSLGYEDRRRTIERLLKQLNRPALHSLALALNHPKTDEPLYFHTRFPDDLQNLIVELDRLGPTQYLANPVKDLIKSTAEQDVFEDEDEREAQKYMM
eukprot:TRINITY_DN1391_c0_g1_i7.p1 TRINITY_DN1391_c0_g1~~TRINITY_DN1391_c0_g1_i7.p1  ORF type:complete len:513 (+),score=48.09 TRINITY_DN1391_c0_g1_i7:51-1541(+)